MYFLLKIITLIVLFHKSESVTFNNIKVLVEPYNWEGVPTDDKIDVIFLNGTNELSKIGKPSKGIQNTIRIENQFISRLKQGSISNITWVEFLILPLNHIKQIQLGTFGHLPKLITLDLQGNLLDELTEGLFNHLPVWVLKLNSNKIKRIGVGTFSGMVNLAHLDLTDNKINTLNPNWFSPFTKIDFLGLGDNYIEIVPAKAFEYMKNNNSTIFLSNNKIRRIDPEALSGLKTLDWLSLRNNHITEIPEDLFRNISEIVDLRLAENLIHDISKDLFSNTKILNNLDLSDNALTCIPTELGDSMNFTNLKFANNHITSKCVNHLKEWNKNNDNKINID